MLSKEDQAAVHQMWDVVSKYTCPDCFHPQCLALADALIAFQWQLEEATNA